MTPQGRASSACVAALALLLLASRASAADEPPSPDKTAGPATLDRPVSQPNAIQVTGGSDSSTGSIKITPRLSAGPFNQLGITVSAPLSKGSDNTNLATLDGLANSVSVQFTLAGHDLHLATNDPSSWRPAFCQHLAAVYETQPTAKAGKISRTDCAFSDIQLLADVGVSPDDVKAFYDQWNASHWTGPVMLYGLYGKVGYQQFKFSDPTTIAQEQVNHAPWSIGAYFAVQLLSKGHWGSAPLLTLGYQHQSTYTDADSKTLCPAGSGGVTTCTTGPVGPPKFQLKDIVSFEVRDRVSDAFAFAVTTSYDARSKVFGVDAPLYLVSDGKLGLSGGVRLGWRSDTHAATASIFVSKAFDAFATP